MGQAIGGMLGIGGSAGDKGLQWGPESAALMGTVNDKQLSTSYDQTQDALKQQLSFLQALQGQNGIQNQSNVYNQLSGVANGTGPNPAAAMLANATGQNAQQQAALMASQRGAGANVGLMARQAANVGSNLQQQAAGQGAAMQAQQSLGALNAMGNLAGQQVGQQAQAVGNYNTAAQNQQQNLLNAGSNLNSAQVAAASNRNNANGALAQQGAKQQGDIYGSMLGGGAKALMLADGGQVPSVTPAPAPSHKYAEGGPVSNVGAFFAGIPNTAQMTNTNANAGNINIGSMPAPDLSGKNAVQAGWDAVPDKAPKQAPMASAGMGKAGFGDTIMAADGGVIDQITQLAPLAMAMMAQGGNVGGKLKSGGKVPGQAKVPGNSLKNDTVSAKLSPQEIVLPRSVTLSSDPVGNAAKFVAALMAKRGKR